MKNKTRKYYCAFDGDRQMTPWITDKVKTISKVRKAFGLKFPKRPTLKQSIRLQEITLKSKYFMEQATSEPTTPV